MPRRSLLQRAAATLGLAGPPAAREVFDPRVGVAVPAFAEDPMNVPVGVRVQGLADVDLITVLVDRNPIRKVLDSQPVAARVVVKTGLSLRSRARACSARPQPVKPIWPGYPGPAPFAAERSPPLTPATSRPGAAGCARVTTGMPAARWPSM